MALTHDEAQTGLIPEATEQTPNPGQESEHAVLASLGGALPSRWADMIDDDEERYVPDLSGPRKETTCMTLTHDEAQTEPSPEAKVQTHSEQSEPLPDKWATPEYHITTSPAGPLQKYESYSHALQYGLPESSAPPPASPLMPPKHSTAESLNSSTVDRPNQSLSITLPKPSSEIGQRTTLTNVLSSMNLWMNLDMDWPEHSNRDKEGYLRITRTLFQYATTFGTLRAVRTHDRTFWRERYSYHCKRLQKLESRKAACLEDLEAKRRKLSEYQAELSEHPEEIGPLSEEIIALEQEVQSLTESIDKVKDSTDVARDIKRQLNNYDKKLGNGYAKAIKRLEKSETMKDVLAVEQYLHESLDKWRELEDDLVTRYRKEDLREDLRARHWLDANADGQDDGDCDDQDNS